MLSLLDIIGLKIVAIKGYRPDRRKKDVPIEYIFFDDGETYIKLGEQDFYTYHDCDNSARLLYLIKNRKIYESLIRGLEDSSYLFL